MFFRIKKNQKIFFLATIVFFAFQTIFFSKNLENNPEVFSVIAETDPKISEIIQLINNARFENNLSKLNHNEKLQRIAQTKSEDMKKKNYFSHNSPDGLYLKHWIEKSGYCYEFAGENLSRGYYDAREMVGDWMNFFPIAPIFCLKNMKILA